MKGFFSFGASAITSVVGKTVTGGLDALETIGRKTMDVLQEGDSEAIRRQGNAGGERGRLSEVSWLHPWPNLSALLTISKESMLTPISSRSLSPVRALVRALVLCFLVVQMPVLRFR